MATENVLKDRIEQYKNLMYLYCEEQKIDPNLVIIDSNVNKLVVFLDPSLTPNEIIIISKKCKDLELELFTETEEEDTFE